MSFLIAALTLKVVAKATLDPEVIPKAGHDKCSEEIDQFLYFFLED
jgi:hypothetical protein